MAGVEAGVPAVAEGLGGTDQSAEDTTEHAARAAKTEGVPPGLPADPWTTQDPWSSSSLQRLAAQAGLSVDEEDDDVAFLGLATLWKTAELGQKWRNVAFVLSPDKNTDLPAGAKSMVSKWLTSAQQAKDRLTRRGPPSQRPQHELLYKYCELSEDFLVGLRSFLSPDGAKPVTFFCNSSGILRTAWCTPPVAETREVLQQWFNGQLSLFQVWKKFGQDIVICMPPNNLGDKFKRGIVDDLRQQCQATWPQGFMS